MAQPQVITKKSAKWYSVFSISAEYKGFLSKLKKAKNMEIENLKKKIKENKMVYPNQKINDFDDKLLGDLITLQELYLRNVLEEKIPMKVYEKSSIFSDLPQDIKIMMVPINMRIMRYKRLFDMFFQAATVEEQKKGLLKGDWWKPNIANIGTDKFWNFDLRSVEELRKKWNLPTSKQLETMINNSMDTRLCLTLILQINEFNYKTSVPYKPDEDGNIKIAEHWLLSKEGKIFKEGQKDSKTNYILSGIEVGSIYDSTDNAEKVGMESLEKAKADKITKDSNSEIKDTVLTWLGDRNPFGSNEQLPKEDITWPLIWKTEDNKTVGSVFQLQFIEKKTESRGFVYGKYGKQSNQLVDKSLLKEGGTHKRRRYPSRSTQKRRS